MENRNDGRIAHHGFILGEHKEYWETQGYRSRGLQTKDVLPLAVRAMAFLSKVLPRLMVGVDDIFYR